jgi:hypothetical protein
MDKLFQSELYVVTLGFISQVLWSQDGLAIISGINPDAPLGTKLSFINGGTG